MSQEKGTAKRLIHGTAVTWIRLATTIAAQILTTPVYLLYWSAETYGTWLLLIAAVSFLQIPGTSFQNYVGYDLMRLVAKDKPLFSRLLFSAASLGAVYVVVEFAIAILIAFTLIPSSLGAGAGESLAQEASLAFLVLAAGAGLVWNWGGVWVRGANAAGYYARGAWWGVADGLVKTVAPLIVLPLHFGILQASWVMALSLVVLHLFTIVDLRRLVRTHLGDGAACDWRLAWDCFKRSQVLALKAGLEMLRQHGIRLVLGPLLGAVELAAFATMRTGANAALQGLSSITNPLMPELMRFLSKKDGVKSEAAMGMVWMIVIALMSPSVVVLQFMVGDLFHWWTQGKIPFNPLFFATISSGVLIYAAAQPALAIVQGNNLVMAQFVNALIAAAFAVGGTLWFGHEFGLVGVGLSLLAAEVVSAAGFVMTARTWLAANEMKWPACASVITLCSVLASSLSMVAMALHPNAKTWILAIDLPIFLAILASYIRGLPDVARDMIRVLAKKLPFSKFILRAV